MDGLAMSGKLGGKSRGCERGEFLVLVYAGNALHQLPSERVLVCPIRNGRSCRADFAQQVGIAKQFIAE